MKLGSGIENATELSGAVQFKEIVYSAQFDIVVREPNVTVGLHDSQHVARFTYCESWHFGCRISLHYCNSGTLMSYID